MRQVVSALGALLSIASAAQAETQAMRYLCERGVEIPAVYVNAAGLPGVAVILVEGRMINLEAMIAASGVRYAFPSGGSGYQWWTHQGEARLSWHDGETDEETILYGACKIVE